MEVVVGVAVVGVVAYLAWKYWLKDKLDAKSDE